MKKSKAQMRAEMEALTAGVQPRKIAEGVGNGMTHRQWYRAARDVEVERIVSENDLIDQRIDLGHAVVNGLGETIYIGE